MLPLVSNTSPIESGASSLENALISCSDLVFKQPEIVTLEPGHKTVEWIGDGDIDQYQRAVDLDISRTRLNFISCPSSSGLDVNWRLLR